MAKNPTGPLDKRKDLSAMLSKGLSLEEIPHEFKTKRPISDFSQVNFLNGFEHVQRSQRADSTGFLARRSIISLQRISGVCTQASPASNDILGNIIILLFRERGPLKRG